MESDLTALEPAEAREFVVDAWRMVVPKKLSRAQREQAERLAEALEKQGASRRR